MRLYIAEKPSMGRELAKCLKGPVRKKEGCLVTGEGVVTWLFGHILRQAEPEEYDGKYKFWHSEDLPIVPKEWKLIVAKGCEKQFSLLKELIAQADEIVHAGDPDREGQLLVDEVLDYLGNKKPVKRILLNALDEQSIKKANANLRENEDFHDLKQSALARARADWLIGMNLSRAYTLAARRAGHEGIVLPIGRVKTPTLALVVRREREIENFRPVDHYVIRAEFAHKNGSFTAQWKPREEQPGLDSDGRLLDRKIAEEKLAAFLEEPREGMVSSCQKARKKEPAPLPFSLSSLQVLAGKRFGYEPQLVLDTVQGLYEKKLTTYPRSDCEYLPQNQFGDAKTILENLCGIDDGELSRWSGGADEKLKSRAWNDKKISAHHAIIPTTVKVKLESLSEAERNLYFLIARGYIAQFYPLHLYDQTKVEVLYKDELFTAVGRTEQDLGWKVMYLSGKKKEEEKEEDEEESALPPMRKKDGVRYGAGTLQQRSTKPPVRFTPATLLAGMKEIHKYVKNPEAKKQLKDVYGIGTEATRATIIDDLIRRKFLIRKGRKNYLLPQPSAYLLVDALPDEMTYPDSTAIWEDRLHSMSEGEGSLEEFLESQIEFTRKLCQKAYGTRMAVQGEHPCPRCGNGILMKRHGRNGDFWGCSNYPRCRMSCDDRDGSPDLARAGAPGKGAPGSFAVRRNVRAGRGNGAGEGAVYTVSDFREAPPPDVFEVLGASYPTEEEMAEYRAAYPPRRNPMTRMTGSRGFQRWDTGPKYSSRPMEHWKDTGGRTENMYLCPHCREGNLRKIRGRNGAFWGCTNYPRCTATFDDSKDGPVLG